MNEPIDPEFLAAMEAAGVTHRPGMGAELMEELRPLLAADGIDLDAIDVNIDTFNEAMTRAIERRNMELSTPTGDDRVAALDVLAAFTLLAHGRHTDDALDLIDKVGPYPSTAFPSVSQVIGTALGLLDTWLAEPPPFHVFYLPYPSYGRRPAGDILAAAGDGGSYASMNGLLMTHGGKAVLHGAAISVASYLACLAKHLGRDVSDLCDELLSAAPTRRSSRSPQPETRPRELGWQRRLRRSLRVALGNGATPGQEATLDDAMGLFDELLDLGDARGLDLRLPDDVLAVGRELAADRSYAEEHRLDLYWMLGIYVSHRIHLGEDAEAWKDVQAVVGAQKAEAEDAVTKLLTDRMLRFDRAETAEALGRVAVCERVPDLLAWIGAGRAVTATGAIRRADLRFTAGLLGIDVIGVNRRPRQPGGIGAALPVLSMDAVPPLTIWWDHLLNSQIIELDGGRVRRGARADAFLADRQDERLTLTYDIALSTALMYVTDDVEWNISTGRAFEILAAALVRGEDDVDAPLSRELESLPLTSEMVKAAGSPVVTGAWVGQQADHIINELARIGLLEMSANGRPRVRRGLARALAAVLLRVRSHLPGWYYGKLQP